MNKNKFKKNYFELIFIYFFVYLYQYSNLTKCNISILRYLAKCNFLPQLLMSKKILLSILEINIFNYIRIL